MWIICSDFKDDSQPNVEAAASQRCFAPFVAV
jgi:hypothetical protein